VVTDESGKIEMKLNEEELKKVQDLVEEPDTSGSSQTPVLKKKKDKKKIKIPMI